jgi:alkyl hydroperoxide reductase subunit AhpF
MLKITILGSGPDSNQLSEHVLRAANELSLEFEMTKTDNQDEIIEHGVIVTPAMLLNGRTVFSGTMPTVEEIVGVIKEAL